MKPIIYSGQSCIIYLSNSDLIVKQLANNLTAENRYARYQEQPEQPMTVRLQAISAKQICNICLCSFIAGTRLGGTAKDFSWAAWNKMLQRIKMLLICALLVAAPARADTAPPFAAAFGRLVEPGETAAQAATVAIPTVDDSARRAAIDCLALAINYEAGREPAAGQAAVAEVILNRVRHPAFPKTVCGVVYQGSERRTGCQFSFTCDGSLARRRDPRIWGQAIAIATEVLEGQRAATVGRATHYHADYVNPYWAPALTRVAVIGRHIFYRFPGTESTAIAGAAAPPAPAPAASFAPWGLTITLPVPSSM